MVQKEKTKTFDIPEEHLQKFANPEQAREYMAHFNTYL